MSFQQQVFLQQGFGVVGEFFDNSPRRCEPFTLNTGTAANNVFGRAFTVNSAAPQNTVAAGGTGVYAGIMVQPKAQALYPAGPSSTLAPTLTMPNGAIVEIANMGVILVSVTPNSTTYPVNVGDAVIFSNADGTLQTIAPGTALPSGFTGARAVVDRVQAPFSSGNTLAVIRLTITPVAPS